MAMKAHSNTSTKKHRYISYCSALLGLVTLTFKGPRPRSNSLVKFM